MTLPGFVTVSARLGALWYTCFQQQGAISNVNYPFLRTTREYSL